MITLPWFRDRAGNNYPPIELPSAVKRRNRRYKTVCSKWSMPAETLATGIERWQHEPQAAYVIQH